MRNHRPILVILILIVIFFFPYIYKSQGFLFGDNLTQRIPSLFFWKQEISNGRILLWNPYLLGGIPFFADLSNNVLAPTNIIYLILPVPLALTLLVIFYTILAAIFTYYLMHTLTEKITPSVFSAVIFTFSGSFTASMNDINSLQGIAYLPIIFFTAILYLKKKSLRNKFLLIATLSLQFVSSHPQYSYYTWLLLLFFLLVFAKEDIKSRIGTTAKLFLITLGIIAVQLLPFLELSQQVYRPKDISFTSQDPLHIIEFPRLLLAEFYGSWRNGNSWGPGSQLETGLANTEGYVGVFALPLAVYAVLKNRTRSRIFWFVVSVLTLLFSLGRQTPFFALLNYLLPFFTYFRSPIRILAIYSFSLAVLAGYGLLEIEKSNNK